MVLNCFGEQKIGHSYATFLISEDMELLFWNRSVNGRSFFLLKLPPFREKLIESSSLKAVAAKNVISQLTSLLYDTDSQRPIILSRQLLDLDSRAESGDPTSHNEDIVLHGLSLDGLLINWTEEP